MKIVSYGGGTNSTALLIECVQRGIKIDLILFADTGGEKPHTYRYIDMFSQWLQENGMPEIVTVKAQRPSRMGSLENYCLHHNQLPAIAYGFKSCSVQFKIEPVDECLRDNFSQWKNGDIIKLIGMDADEPQRAKDSNNKHYVNEFPLLEWGMGRDECIQSIKNAGLPEPGKSACFFCPSSKVSEIKQLAKVYPELMERALKIESNAKLTSVKGLGRNFAWKDVIATQDMFDDDYLSPELACGCYDG